MTDPDQEEHRRTDPLKLRDVPVTVPLHRPRRGRHRRAPDEVTRRSARWLVAQAAVLHSPRDLQIVRAHRSGRTGLLGLGAVAAARAPSRRAGHVRPDRHRRRHRGPADQRAARAARSPAGSGARPRPDRPVPRARTCWSCSTARAGCGRCPAWPRCCARVRPSASTLLCLDADERLLPGGVPGRCRHRRPVGWSRSGRPAPTTVDDVRPDLRDRRSGASRWRGRWRRSATSAARRTPPLPDVLPAARRARPGAAARPTRISARWRIGRAQHRGGGRRVPATGRSRSTCAGTGRTGWSPAPPAPASRSCCRPSSRRWRWPTGRTR